MVNVSVINKPEFNVNRNCGTSALFEDPVNGTTDLAGRQLYYYYNILPQGLVALPTVDVTLVCPGDP